MVTISELLEADEDELIDELCIVVDCRGLMSQLSETLVSKSTKTSHQRGTT